MKNLKSNWEYLIPVILIVLCAVTLKCNLSSFTYIIVGLLGAIYFFPIRLFIHWENKTTAKERGLFFIQNYVYAMSIGISIFSGILREENNAAAIIAAILGLLLVVNMFIVYVKHQGYKELVMSLLFSILLGQLVV